jgi:hypothetical protein
MKSRRDAKKEFLKAFRNFRRDFNKCINVSACLQKHTPILNEKYDKVCELFFYIPNFGFSAYYADNEMWAYAALEHHSYLRRKRN